ncbi:hypothetical protein AAG570_011966 [Ranatra chinensis]|uniref:Integrase catalytic domain-containing protein n=1 Tax=Ranatra chinensis TaxID=642074 RepID=A0ABD0YHF9_9HEMI
MESKTLSKIERTGEGPEGKAGKIGGESFSDYCTCPSFKECICCGDHEVMASEKAPLFNTKVCVTFGMENLSSLLNVRIKVGLMTVMNEYIDLTTYRRVCRKMEEYDYVEFCTGMKVEKTETRLRVCPWVQAKIQGIFEHPFVLPCINVDKGKGLSLDSKMEGYEQPGIKVNLVELWNKLKGCLRSNAPKVFSDCGKNFVGAPAELKAAKDEEIHRYCAKKGIIWYFNPPYAPNFGGSWEAAVKSAKNLLYKLIGTSPLIFGELATAFIKIEAVLNCRPLCALSCDPLDGPDYLSPGHFLIGSPLLVCPKRVMNEQLSLKTRWTRLRKAFWNRCFSHLIGQPANLWFLGKSKPKLRKDDLEAASIYSLHDGVERKKGTMKNLWFGAIFVAVLLAGARADEDELTEDNVQEILETEFNNQLLNTERELDYLEYISTIADLPEEESDDAIDEEDEYDDEAPRSGFKDKMVAFKEKLKKKCSCESHRVCGCCAKKKIKIPKTSKVFKPKFCTNVTIFPEENKIGIKLLAGPITVFKKRMSLQRFDNMCKHLPNLENIELCFKMKVEQSAEKGLQTCMKAKLKLMSMFKQAVKFPCFNFKDHKLTIDETFMEDGEDDDGLAFDYKAAGEKIKGWFGWGSKATTTPIPDDDF